MKNSGPEKMNYSDPSVQSFLNSLDKLNLENSYYLILLIGPYKKGKKGFMSKFSKTAGSDITTINLQEYITPVETQSRENLDRLFESLKDSGKFISFTNGDILNGEYTGYSYSKQRYSTPQGRYFLKKLLQSEKIALLDIDDIANIGKTVERASQTAILFDKPVSFLNRILFRAKKVGVHGHEFTGDRPPQVA